MSTSTVPQAADLQTVQQVCAYLQISRRTLYNWMRTRKLPYLTLPSGRRRFRARDVAALVRPAQPEQG